MQLNFYNTMARKVVPFTSIEPGKVGMYTCGPTVYNYAHIGNFRAYIFEDLLHRALEYAGYEVKQVMNLTDVDDKTIRDSRAAKLPLKEFTKKYIDAFFADLKTLNITPAAVYPPATGHIPEMIQLVQTLLDKGFAYQAEDKSIYFSIAKFAEYGKLAKIDRENQRAGVRINTDEYTKDAVADFALWKSWDENDGDVWWDSPWGKGRPGWHIECSAMSMKYLGKTFDLHTGGIDNMFPHHEDEIAQSECANGCTYVKYWLHCAHLMVEGEKMSKSLGNFYTLRDLLKRGCTGREIRYVLLGAHYRKKLNFTLESLAQARESLRYFDELFIRLREVQTTQTGVDAAGILAALDGEFNTALADDLNIAGALAVLFKLGAEANKLLAANQLGWQGAQNFLAAFRQYDRIFGYLNVDEAAHTAIPEQVEQLAAERKLARQNKNWAESDRLRDELKQLGYVVEDVPGGDYRIKKL